MAGAATRRLRPDARRRRSSICSITPPPGSRARRAEAAGHRDVRRAVAQTASADLSGLAATVASLAQELSSAAGPALKAWGIGGAATRRPPMRAGGRVAAAAAISIRRGRAALLRRPRCRRGQRRRRCRRTSRPLGDQAGLLGAAPGVLARWLQDSARVRPAAGASATRSCATTSPPSAVGVLGGAVAGGAYDAAVDAASARRWVGLPFPARSGPRARSPAPSIVGDDPARRRDRHRAGCLDRGRPGAAGPAAVAANLTAPDARAPNVILLAVPPDTASPWTTESLLSVVDEALELADCRMVDLDATRRVPLFLPAVYLAEFRRGRPRHPALLQIVHKANTFPGRWVAKETS